MKDLSIAIGCIFAFGLVAHAVIKSIVEKQFLNMEILIRETKYEVVKSQTKIAELEQEIAKLEGEIKDLKTLLIVKIEQEERK